MLSVFYLYNLYSILIYGGSLGICSFVYGSTGRKDMQYASFMMFACVCDSIYKVTEDLLNFRYSFNTLVLTAALFLTLVKIYFIGKIIASIFKKELWPEFYILLCIIVIIHGIFSTFPMELYWNLSPICFNVSILIICGYYYYFLEQEPDAVCQKNAFKYNQIVIIMLALSALALLYIFANLCLFKTNLSRSFIELHADFFALVLSIWYIIFSRKELKNCSIEETENVFQEFQISEPGKRMDFFPQQLADFCKQYILTEREAQILQLILSGKSNQEIAEALYITVGTVKAHIHSIFGKLDITRRSQLITMLLDYKPSKQ